MNLKCIIVDDEPNAVNLLELHIQQTTEWQLVAKCYNALEALNILKNNKADVIFLDINMPKLDGMELAGLLPPDLKIVFTTAYAEYALASYNFQTIDYLLKPITLKRFLTARQKIETAFIHKGLLEATIPDSDYLFLKSGKTLHQIKLSEILYFEGEKEYVRVVTNKSEILIYKRLKELTEQLSPPFTRVHNSYIVNTGHIDKIQDNHIFIAGKCIPLSETFRAPFMELIQPRFL
ncbi:LytTR family two component transcriptional regulator [Chitinophaga niastensis]|uniref:LytTR family two component transcriptional regulator n=1 Tax=Chitinophaga niastensis TaxID=536980 RepID=A0A2P8HHG5_CHINA|nr:LytTR family DNA-binding domain-containing protein [Chitinophaga niastensis]PSL45665.1 LytTR family two component transcriptional regulator [Chitinophaga niastensis]